jgi:hypothetical protein
MSMLIVPKHLECGGNTCDITNDPTYYDQPVDCTFTCSEMTFNSSFKNVGEMLQHFYLISSDCGTVKEKNEYLAEIADQSIALYDFGKCVSKYIHDIARIFMVGIKKKPEDKYAEAYIVLQFTNGAFEARIATDNSLSLDYTEATYLFNGGKYAECETLTNYMKNDIVVVNAGFVKAVTEMCRK